MNALDLSDPRARVVGAILRRQAERIPDVPYVMAGEESYSYGRFNELVNSYATGLRNLGLRPGDTVSLFMRSSLEFLLTTFAANKLGVVWMPINPDYRGPWLRTGLEESLARVLFVDAQLVPRLADLGGQLPFERLVVRGPIEQKIQGIPMIDIGEFAELGKEEPTADVSYSDTAAVIWTSGTTGPPKGVMQSHSSWIWTAQNSARNQQVGSGDVIHNCLPLCASAPWCGIVYTALVAGVTFGLDDYFSVTDFWDRIRFYGATHIFTMGSMHIFLWQAPERPDDRQNPVRVATATPMPNAILEPFKERFGIDVIMQGYGQSESISVCERVDDGKRKWKLNSVGISIPGIDVRLLDENDEEVPAGAVGEFCVRPHYPYTLFNGYFRNPEATLEACRNLWYHTGDLGRRDEDGEFFFHDRKADFIRYKARNISSFAVETVVGAHPAVARSAVYGVTSAELESEAEVKVDVVLKPGQQLTPEELATFVNENAPYFWVPRYIEFVDDLPYTPTGRLQKFKLRKRGVTPRTWDREASGFVVQR
jgi:crotonobetaine/carnitine-CoA ligase